MRNSVGNHFWNSKEISFRILNEIPFTKFRQNFFMEFLQNSLMEFWKNIGVPQRNTAGFSQWIPNKEVIVSRKKKNSFGKTFGA